MIELGNKVKDKVSGFEGVAISRHSYLNGCTRISVQPPVDKDGKLPECETFDEPQLEEIKTMEVYRKPQDEEATKLGGPERYMPKPRR